MDIYYRLIRYGKESITVQISEDDDSDMIEFLSALTTLKPDQCEVRREVVTDTDSQIYGTWDTSQLAHA